MGEQRNRVIVKRTSSAVRTHPRGPSPESLSLATTGAHRRKSRSPGRRFHTKPPNTESHGSSRTTTKSSNGRRGRHATRLFATSALTFLITCWIINVYSFVTDTARYTGEHRGRGVGSGGGRQLRAGYTTTNSNTNGGDDEDPAKAPILKLLREAGVRDIDAEMMERLPTWKQVTDLYGTEPVLYGLDTCQAFRESGEDPGEHLLGVAGTFNTGTNLLAELLIHNCEMPARMAKYGEINKGIRWQVRK